MTRHWKFLLRVSQFALIKKKYTLEANQDKQLNAERWHHTLAVKENRAGAETLAAKRRCRVPSFQLRLFSARSDSCPRGRGSSVEQIESLCGLRRNAAFPAGFKCTGILKYCDVK